MAETVLIVEDEADIAEILAFNLQQAGYETRAVRSGQEALSLLTKQHTLPDLVLLDLMLPDMSGNEICKRLRSDSATQALPVIMLTARGEEVDRVLGLELGADDYVVKPFSVRELLLRVRAVLRRGAPEEPAATAVRKFGCLRIDEEAHRIWVHDAEVSLTALEFRLITTLLDRRGRVQTRERLLEEVWQMPAELTTRTVDTHVKRLRQKLGDAGGYVQTVRGVGYRFVDEPEDA